MMTQLDDPRLRLCWSQALLPVTFLVTPVSQALSWHVSVTLTCKFQSQVTSDWHSPQPRVHLQNVCMGESGGRPERVWAGRVRVWVAEDRAWGSCRENFRLLSSIPCATLTAGDHRRQSPFSLSEMIQDPSHGVCKLVFVSAFPRPQSGPCGQDTGHRPLVVGKRGQDHSFLLLLLRMQLVD